MDAQATELPAQTESDSVADIMDSHVDCAILGPHSQAGCLKECHGQLLDGLLDRLPLALDGSLVLIGTSQLLKLDNHDCSTDVLCRQYTVLVAHFEQQEFTFVYPFNTVRS